MELAGKVVVVPVGWGPAAELAERLGGQGATVVLVAQDGEEGAEAGRLAARLEADGSGRPAVFVADSSPGSLDGLAAFLSEMFRSP